MKRCWFVTILSTILSLHIHIATAAIPNLSTIDNYRVVVGGKNKRSYAADDIFNDEQTAPIEITHMLVRSEIALRYARTTIISKVHNPSDVAQEATFQVLLPDTAFISGFTMAIGNESYEAFVKEKEVAQFIYDDAVSQGISAGHVASKARDSKNFVINLNLEKKAKAKYRLTYEELLVRRNKKYNHAINLLPGGLVPNLEVVVHIKESQKITKLKVPELRTGNEIDATEDDPQNTIADIKRSKNEAEAIITFAPDLAEQRRLAEIQATKKKESDDIYTTYIGYDSEEESDENGSFLGQFVVQYDVEQPKNGEILVNDGYFVHFLAPSSLPPLSKHVVFVLDTSGSMSGNKIEQLRKAMNAILSDLRATDYFSIIEFNYDVQVHDIKKAYKPGQESKHGLSSTSVVAPTPATQKNIDAAKTFVSQLKAFGGTNIYTALYTAINLIQNGIYSEDLDEEEYELEPIIIFLSDGEPTEGETDSEQIIMRITEKNSGKKRAPLFSLAFGNDADRVFLRKLSLRNDGFMRHIYEASDAALQLQDFYRQVSSPLLANVTFVYPTGEVIEGSVSRNYFRTINDGSEVAVVGKIAKGIDEITCRVFGLKGDTDGRSRKLYEANHKVPVNRGKDDYLPLERLWAYLTIKQLLDKRDSGDKKINIDFVERKALTLALRFKFVTPLTSLVVVRQNKTYDDSDDTFNDPSFIPHRGLSTPTKARRPYIEIKIDENIKLPLHGSDLFIQSDSRLVVGVFDSSKYRKRQHEDVDVASPTRDKLIRRPGSTMILPGLSGSSGGFGASAPSTLSHPGPRGGSGSSGKYNHGGGHGSFGAGAGGYGQNSGLLGGKLDSINGYSGGGGGGIHNLLTTQPPTTTIQHAVYEPPTTIQHAVYVPKIEVNEDDITSDTSSDNEYHLEGYEWTTSLLDNSTDTLVFKQNESQIILKLTKRIIPPKERRGDKKCDSKVRPVGEGTICVYLTRCLTARSITVEDYQKSYCFIRNRYAGVCCPENEIDRIP